MATRTALGLGRPIDEVVDTAVGATHRQDPVRPVTGGPAGNARLTAWLGIGLLLLFLAETATLVSVTGLIDPHLVIGAVLIPLTLAKTATTGWRMVRYYTGVPDYVAAGPPPLLLRLLGPLVVLGALAVLGSGLALIAVGPRHTFEPFATVAGFGISPLTVHQAAFVVWLAAAGLHVLARTVPAVQLSLGSRTNGTAVPGRLLRAATLAVLVVPAVAAGVIVLHLSGAWTHHSVRHTATEVRRTTSQ